MRWIVIIQRTSTVRIQSQYDTTQGRTSEQSSLFPLDPISTNYLPQQLMKVYSVMTDDLLKTLGMTFILGIMSGNCRLMISSIIFFWNTILGILTSTILFTFIRYSPTVLTLSLFCLPSVTVAVSICSTNTCLKQLLLFNSSTIQYPSLVGRSLIVLEPSLTYDIDHKRI